MARKKPPETGRLTVVVIGASAGGVSALHEVLAQAEPGPSIAVLVVQHLGEGDHALAAQTLSHLTRLRVRVLEDQTTLAPGTVYCVPARTFVDVEGDRVVLKSAQTTDERLAVIDRAFAAVARAHRDRAVGVILSGEASDGAGGLSAINAAGGLTLAQVPATAEHRSMPEAALATGTVDHVLRPGEIWPQIKAYIDSTHGGDRGRNLHDEICAALTSICEILLERTRHDFKHYKSSTLVRRIQRRIQVLQLGSVDAYLETLGNSRLEVETLFKELLINVTAFFRDPEAFDALKARVLRPLVRAARPGQKLRVWIPGCSTGEEAYTMAILILEVAAEDGKSVELQILATDIDDQALTIARRGSYGASVAEAISPERLARYFVKRAGRYHVSKELREACLFSIHNLINDPPYSQLDLISCRNLLIYLGSHLQQKLFPVFHYALRSHGYLFLGTSETLTSHKELFRSLDGKHRILQRKPTAIKLPSINTSVQAYVNHFQDHHRVSETDLSLIGQRIALDEMPLRYAIVNDEGQILAASGGLNKYIQVNEGAFHNHVVKLVNPSLRTALRSAFATARRERRKVTNEGSTLAVGDQVERTMVIVQPMPRLGDVSELYWVAFQSLGRLHARTASADAPPEDQHELIEQLERELSGARRELERTVQDLEASNEELKSSNEELLSMNEELQSANEELETSKEEVQNANETLQRTNLDLENLLASTQIATLFLDENYRIRGFTPAAAEIYNVRPADVGRPLADFTSRAEAMPPYPPTPLAVDRVHDQVNLPDGRIFLRRILPYRTAEGRRDGIVVTFIDVTESRRSDERFRQLADSVPVITWTAAPDGRVEFFNRRWFEYSGQDDSLGWSWSAVIHPDDLANTERTWTDALDSGRDYRIEYRLRRADGHYRWHRGAAVGVRDRRGHVTAWFGTCVDIHEQRERADLLEASGRALRTIIEAIPQYVWRTTPDGAADYASERFQAFTGRTEADLLGWGWIDLIHPDDRPAVESEWAARRAAGEPVVVDFRIRRGSTDEYRWVRSEGNPFFNSAGQIEKYYGTWTDVHEQRHAAEALRSSEEHFRKLVDNTPATIWITDRESRCTYLSKQWYEITGRTPAEDLGWGWIENVHPDDRAAAGASFVASVRDRARVSLRYRLRHRDGRYRWALDLGAPLVAADGEFQGYIGSVTDIHEQVANEEKLEALRERFDRSAAATDLGVWYCDLPFDKLIWNTEVKRHFFMPPEHQVVIDDFYAHILPEDRGAVRAAIDRSIAEHAPYDVQMRTFDGRDPARFKWVRAIGWTDYEGARPVRFDGITLDVSAEYRRETELTEAKHEAERAREVAEVASESKTRFLANMSHEIRTPLSAIVGYSELLSGLVTRESEVSSYVERISRNSAHLGRLIDELLDLSKIEADKLEVECVPVDVERVVEDVLSAMHLKADAKGLRMSVHWEVPRPLRLMTDPVRLAQVLTNIIGNALKFTEEGEVRVTVTATDERLLFHVSDTGIGLDDEQCRRLFEPFSQADPSVSRKYGGTGLGLNLSRQLARLLGGDLRLEHSQVGRGSVFVIEIAATAVPARPEVAPSSDVSPARSALEGRHILVVDDSPDNRTIVGLFLASAGARVSEATNGDEGVRAAVAGRFDLVLMDIQMPTMDGYQALTRLQELGYRPPVVALTAHAFKEERDRCLRVGFTDYVTKPISRTTLIETVRLILAK